MRGLGLKVHPAPRAGAGLSFWALYTHQGRIAQRAGQVHVTGFCDEYLFCQLDCEIITVLASTGRRRMAPVGSERADFAKFGQKLQSYFSAACRMSELWTSATKDKAIIICTP